MRSQFEKTVSEALPKHCKYESIKLDYVMTYTPDFADDEKGILYEIKGRLDLADAAKLLKVKKLLPFEHSNGVCYNEIILIPMVSDHELCTWNAWRMDTDKAKAVPMRSGKQLCWWCSLNGFRYFPASSNDTTLVQELTNAVRCTRLRGTSKRKMGL